MMQNNDEIRVRSYASCEMRAAEGGREIEGYAIVFGQESQPLWARDGKPCVEVIAPEAVSRELLDSSDIKMTMYHDMGRLLARSKRGKGTLGYEIDERGVKFRFTAPNTQWGDEALALVRSGDIDGCSFMFAAKYKEPDVTAEERDGQVVYTVRKIRALYDFTLTPDPAYEQTECSARAASVAEAETQTQTIDEPNQITDMADNTNTNTESRWDELNSRVEALEIAQREIPAPASPAQRTYSLAGADDELRRAREGRYDVTVSLQRDATTTAAVEGTGIIPVAEQAVMGPLVEGLIWGQLGIPVATGLAGELRWPFYGKTTASWEDEAAELADSSIDFGKLTMSGKRLGVAIPVTREALEDSRSNIVESAVTEQMPLACQLLINAAMLTLYADKKNGSAVVEKAVYGPFAQSANRTADNCAIKEFAGSVPTRKELLQMKSQVAATGVAMRKPCWIMNEAMKAELEDAKVDAGSGRFVCENGQILGCPVFTSSEVPDGAVLFGDWSYEAAGFFGQTSMVIDPYTLARRHSVDFVLNMRFGAARLRKEAFILGRTNAVKTAMNTQLAALTVTAES